MNEQYAEIDDRHHEAIDTGNFDILDEIFDPGFVGHELTWPGTEISGIDAYKDYLRNMRASFPDLHGETVQRVSEGDVLVCRTRMTGTQRGEFMGTPPSGRHIVIDVVNFLRFRDGKIVESTFLYDGMQFAVQLGLLPEPTAAPA